ncbi:MAG: hypothetical protein KJS73_11270 [Gammaproteobacteria bacterium]|nr:hypothetical protein [Gammaproteobacteria bacterium]
MSLSPTTVQIIAAALFAVAIIHTFSTKYFEHLAHTRPAHSGLWHLLGEVEIVFGFWALVLAVVMVLVESTDAMKQYVNSRNFTEPLFVFVIMVVAATRPILQTSKQLVEVLSKLIPGKGGISTYFIVLTVVPLLGSFITEPAAMTLAALMLADKFFSRDISSKLKYATIGVLFVNISIGGTLTAYAAPPVLMVAGTWNWDTAFMLTQFGWKAAIAVFVNGIAVTLLFARELAKVATGKSPSSESPIVPMPLVLIHIVILAGIVLFAHYPPLFIGLFLLFMGIATAYSAHQDRLILREGLLVAFFLGGLVVLGGQQQWWLQPLLVNMSSDAVFYGATALTAITDNAALTYLGSLVEGLSDEFKYSLVTGAVTGGGLTIIANAPNPAGVAILRRYFDEGAVSPTGLLVSALLPTLVALLAFRYL